MSSSPLGEVNPPEGRTRATYHLSHVALTLEAPDDVARQFHYRWRGCSSAIVPSSMARTLSVHRTGDGCFRLALTPSERPPRTVKAALVLSELERLIYGALRGWHLDANLTLMHAALVADGRGRSLLFAGPSGAGKSSMTLAAVQAGWRYASDDLVATDGERMWGIPRALQFDPVAPKTALIPRLAGLERLIYTVHLEDGEIVQPAWILSEEHVTGSPARVETTHVVSLEIAESEHVDTVNPHLPGETTAALVAATYDWPTAPVTWTGKLPAGFRLRWRDPTAAFERLTGMLPPVSRPTRGSGCP